MIPAKQIILWLTVLFACLLPASALTPCTSETSVWESFSIGHRCALYSYHSSPEELEIRN
jgi:hypothetical protein